MSDSREQIEIRSLDSDDASAWWTLRLEALQCEPEAFSASVDAHHNLREDDVRARLSDDPEKTFVIGAMVAGELVGTAGFVREDGLKERHKGRIWGVYLGARVRGKGIGRMMLQYLLDRASQIVGLEQIRLSVATTQTAAISLYRSLGFTPFGCEIHALKVRGRYLDEEYMVLFLKR